VACSHKGKKMFIVVVVALLLIVGRVLAKGLQSAALSLRTGPNSTSNLPSVVNGTMSKNFNQMILDIDDDVFHGDIDIDLELAKSQASSQVKKWKKVGSSTTQMELTKGSNLSKEGSSGTIRSVVKYRHLINTSPMPKRKKLLPWGTIGTRENQNEGTGGKSFTQFETPTISSTSTTTGLSSAATMTSNSLKSSPIVPSAVKSDMPSITNSPGLPLSVALFYLLRAIREFLFPERFIAMFRLFKFKGIGVSFVKSIVKLRSCGFGFRIPITPHFPEYDRHDNLPRFSSFIGIFYPAEYRFSISVSFPLHTAKEGFRVCVNAMYLKALAAFLEKFKRAKATNSVRRVGMTLTFRWSQTNGFVFSIGPWIFYLPGMRTMQYVLPVVFAFPSAVVAALNLFFNIDPYYVFKSDILDGILDSEDIDGDGTAIEGFSQQFIGSASTAPNTSVVAFPPQTLHPIPPDSPRDVKQPWLIETAEASTEIINKNMIQLNKQIRTKSRPKSSKTKMTSKSETTKRVNLSQVQAPQHQQQQEQLESTPPQTKKMPRGFMYWHRLFLKLSVSKTTGLGYNVGWYRYRNADASMGSSLLFDIQPFFDKKLPKFFKQCREVIDIYNKKILFATKI